eukprot:m.1527102 g.1527102  ORF g.1527102 m.1527102 type:complete len:718 (+) comp25234_c0_seq63:229-2382(+)
MNQQASLHENLLADVDKSSTERIPLRNGHRGRVPNNTRSRFFKCVSRWKSAAVCFIFIPLLMGGIGAVIDAILYQHSAPPFNAIYLTIDAYIAAPVLFVFINWPRHRKNDKLPATSRIGFDIAVNVIFLVLLMVLISRLSTADRASNDLTSAIKKNILAGAGGGPEDISDPVSFYEYITNTLIPNLIPDSTQAPLMHSVGVPIGIFGGVETFFPFTIRQVRVGPLDVEVWPGYERKFYPTFSGGRESKEAYGPDKATLQQYAYTDFDAWARGFAAQPHNEQFINGQYSAPFYNFSVIMRQIPFLYQRGAYESIQGRTVTQVPQTGPDHHTMFPAGGFQYSFPTFFYNLSHVDPRLLLQADMAYLQSNNWIDLQTRLVTVETTLAVPGTHKWATVVLQVTFSAAGLVTTRSSIMIGTLDADAVNFGKTTTVLASQKEFYLLVFFMAVYQVGSLAARVYERRSLVQVLTKDYILPDIITYTCVIVAWGLGLTSIYYWPVLDLEKCHNPPFVCSFNLISTAAAWQSSIDFIGFAVISAWLRLIEYMALLPFVGKIPRAMMNALKTVGFFLFTLAIVFAGFVFGFSTIYSASSTQFSTPTQSMLTLWGSLLGNIDVDEFLVSNYYIGIFLFMWFSFIVLFTCLTFMISVITEAYHAEAELEKEFFDKHCVDSEYGTTAKKWKRLVVAYFNETQRKKEIRVDAPLELRPPAAHTQTASETKC